MSSGQTKMKDINGGVKILAVDGAIENPRGTLNGKTKMEWNGLESC